MVTIVCTMQLISMQDRVWCVNKKYYCRVADGISTQISKTLEQLNLMFDLRPPSFPQLIGSVVDPLWPDYADHGLP